MASGSAARGWAAAAAVYFLAVFNRSSLGVAGLVAERRFHVGPGALSVFVLLQLGVYAAMQIPTGILVDRFGPKRLLVVAASVMAVAQLAFALVGSFPFALIARALLGCGDALTFISVLRYTATHFSARRYPLMVAATALLGTIGNVGATAPLTALLSGPGWTTSFLIAAGGSTAAAFGVIALVREPTTARRTVRRTDIGDGVRIVRGRVMAAWQLAGTRLAFWVHFANMSVATTFALLWGHPYLVEGVRFTPSSASRLLMIAVIVVGIANPTVGVVTGRWPSARIPLSLAVCAVTVAGLVVLIAGATAPPPKALAAVVFIVAMLGGPASITAFSVARDYNPPAMLGTASGVVNVAGFLATIVSTVAFGAVLDVQGAVRPHTMRYALIVLAVVEAFGMWRLAVWYRRVRAEVRRRQEAGEPVPVSVGRVRWFDVRELEGPVVTEDEVRAALDRTPGHFGRSDPP